MNTIKSAPLYLNEHIQLFYSICASPSKSLNGTHCRVPDGTLDLIFNFGDPVLLSDDGICFFPMPDIAITGLYQKAKYIRHTGNTHLVGVVFRPGYAHEMVGEVLHSFQGCVFDATLVFGTAIMSLHAQLNVLPDETARHLLIESYLSQKLSLIKPTHYSSRLHAATRQFQQHNGNVDITALYKQYFISERTFRRRFLECVGISPKKYATIVKVKAFIRQYGRNKGSLYDVAAALNYADLSHFIKDFRKITNSTPAQYFSIQNPIGGALLNLIE